MGAIEDAKAYAVLIRESADDGSDFTNPPSDYRRLFLGEDGDLHLKDSAGSVTDIGGGGGSTFSGCAVYHSTTTSASSGVLPFDTEVYDTDSYHSGGNPSRLTAPATGNYRITWGIYTGDATDRVFGVMVNGSNARGGYIAANFKLIGSMELALTSGDYVEINEVSTVATGSATAHNQNTFSIARLS